MTVVVSDPANLPPSERPLHLAVGIFDGVHLGHQAVIETALQLSKRTGGRTAVLTFDPHPSRLFSPQRPTLLMTTFAQKVEKLGRLGIEAVIQKPFHQEFAALPADAFLPWLKQAQPRLASLHIGDNFRFGKGRLGDVATLVSSGAPLGVTVFSTPRLCVNGDPVTSTRIRKLLVDGRIVEANQLLGDPYAFTGPALPGRALGRSIGFPTLNLSHAPELSPRHGVYVASLTSAEGREFQAVANFGLRPTVEAAAPAPLLEVHALMEPAQFLKLNPNDANALWHVELLDFLRPESRFSGLEELKGQIARDVEAARGWWSAKNVPSRPAD